MTRTLRTLTTGTALILTAAWSAAVSGTGWTRDEIETMTSLSISSLEPLPPDPTNRYADDARAAAFGRELFFDERLSLNGRVSCATCHMPDREFQDGSALARGIGTTTRRTMPIAGTAHAPFLFWDGRKDSLWAQALGPLESAVEHGGTRAQYAHVVARHHKAAYETIFGTLPDLGTVPAHAGPVDDAEAARSWNAMHERDRDSVTRIFVNVGKAIAAFERTIQYGPSRFDEYVDGLSRSGMAPRNVLSEDEIAGLRLFMGKANCTQCHNGPLLTNNEFHNTGVPSVKTLPADAGRVAGIKAVLSDEFNCRSRWSDSDTSCAELDFMPAASHDSQRAFKVPSLRGVANRAPHMHAGQFATLAQVLDHYNRAPQAPAGHSELEPLRLNARELRQLESFLRSLTPRR